MPEKARNTHVAAILAAGTEQHQGNPCVYTAMAYLRGDIMAVRFKNSNRRNDVRHYRWLFSDLLDFAGLSSNLAYITSVFIGYIGTDSIGSLIKTPAAKKAG